MKGNPFASYAARSARDERGTRRGDRGGNPFASYAACSAQDGGSRRGGGGGWMSSRRAGRDDSVIRAARGEAEEARRARNRRSSGARSDARGGGRSKAGERTKAGKDGRGRKKYDFINHSDEASFEEEEEEEEHDEEDSFIVDDDSEALVDSEEEEGDWDFEMEDDHSNLGSKEKKKAMAAFSRSPRAGYRNALGAHWKPPTRQNSAEEIEESPLPPSHRRTAKKAAESPISLESDEEVDYIHAPTTCKEKADSDPSSTRRRFNKARSRYFASSKKELDEQKKEGDDESVSDGAEGNANKKRRILDDSEDEEDKAWAMARMEAGCRTRGHAVIDTLELLHDDDGLADTPRKSPRNLARGSSFSLDDFRELKPSFNMDDFVNDDEAVAIERAMEMSLADQGRIVPLCTRLKKRLGKAGLGKGRRQGFASSLERIEKASPPKEPEQGSEAPKYKDEADSVLDSDDGGVHGDDEADAYGIVDEEERTAVQVLAEANDLSARIVEIVSGWCGKDEISGLILGRHEGALSLGGGAAVGGLAASETWISDGTMKEILPNVSLAEYQLLGVNWMALLNRTVFGSGKGSRSWEGMNVNGILADEMGLGKTVQTIAFLAWLNCQNKSGGVGQRQRPHLIVVPASVLSNWMNEFRKFAPDMKVAKYHGTQVEREGIRGELDRRHVQGNELLDVVLTTFSYFSSDGNRGDRSFLRKFEFDYLVVDEGHTLKNPKGLRYQNLKKLQTSHRLLLTGTPVQNSPKELMSLLCFLMPLFDSKTKSSKRGRGYNNESDDDNDGGERMLEYFVHLEGGSPGAGADSKAYRKLKQLFAPFVLRRKKVDVLGQILPPKTRKVDVVPMDGATRAAYDAILSNHVKARAEKGSGGVATNAAAQKHLFTVLRKAANHPLLLRNRSKGEGERDTLARLALDYGWFGNDSSCTLQLVRDELDKYSDYEVHCAAMQMIEENPTRREYLEKFTLMEEDLFCSPKFVRLRALLPELIGKGHRILVFSQWTKVLDLMGHLMESLGLRNLRLDGQTPVAERQDLIDAFADDPSIPVFLLSTRAGGMGLNLTSADVCILHDLDFNPFNDRQAEDRCHRIGQKKPVTIIKMVTQGTVDEDIYKIQERKAKMNEAIMEEDGGNRKKSSDNDEICRLASAAVERFLNSPPRTASSSCSVAVVSREGSDTDPVTVDASGKKSRTPTGPVLLADSVVTDSCEGTEPGTNKDRTEAALERKVLCTDLTSELNDSDDNFLKLLAQKS